MQLKSISSSGPFKLVQVALIDSGGVIHRKVLEPGSDLSDELPEIRDFCQDTWDDTVISDFQEERIATVDRLTAIGSAELPAAVSNECRRRIYSVMSQETQMNVAAMAALISSKAASARSAEEKAILAGLEAAIGWVSGMRAAAKVLAADPNADFKDATGWPECPELAVQVIDQF